MGRCGSGGRGVARQEDAGAGKGKSLSGRAENAEEPPERPAHGNAKPTLIDSSQWVPDSAFRGWLETGLRFATKSGSNPMELADVMSRDLFEWVGGDCAVTPKRWDLLSKKVYCRGDGRMGKFGVKVFPDSDLRTRVEEHRIRYGANPD